MATNKAKKVSSKIRKMKKEGKSQKQAVAQALAMNGVKKKKSSKKMPPKKKRKPPVRMA